MGDLWIPGRSPIAKAARGWPSSPNVKPLIPVEIDWSNPLTRGLRNISYFRNTKLLTDDKPPSRTVNYNFTISTEVDAWDDYDWLQGGNGGKYTLTCALTPRFYPHG